MDSHVHAAPDVFGRSPTIEEVALSKDRGLEAVVLKNHVPLTADRAWLARKHVAGLKVFGGVVLNGSAGGINVDAVQWMWRMQGGHGRVVWFPTFDADNHVTRFKEAPEGIKVVGADGKVLPAVREVLKECAAQKLVVETGHPVAEEVVWRSSRRPRRRLRPYRRDPRRVRCHRNMSFDEYEEGRLDGRQAGIVCDG